MRVLEFEEKVWVLQHHSGHCASYTLHRDGIVKKGLAAFRMRDAASEFYAKYGGESPYILTRVPMSQAVEMAGAQDCEVFYIEEYEWGDPGVVAYGVAIILGGEHE